MNAPRPALTQPSSAWHSSPGSRASRGRGSPPSPARVLVICCFQVECNTRQRMRGRLGALPGYGVATTGPPVTPRIAWPTASSPLHLDQGVLDHSERPVWHPSPSGLLGSPHCSCISLCTHDVFLLRLSTVNRGHALFRAVSYQSG